VLFAVDLVAFAPAYEWCAWCLREFDTDVAVLLFAVAFPIYFCSALLPFLILKKVGRPVLLCARWLWLTSDRS
jgi:hypothetical protein